MNWPYHEYQRLVCLNCLFFPQFACKLKSYIYNSSITNEIFLFYYSIRFFSSFNEGSFPSANGSPFVSSCKFFASSLNGRYRTKFIFTSFPSSIPSPIMIKISPGTIKPKLSTLRALSARYISSKWDRAVMIRMVKQLLMRIITSENICWMRILPIMRLNPSMMPM